MGPSASSLRVNVGQHVTGTRLENILLTDAEGIEGKNSRRPRDRESFRHVRLAAGKAHRFWNVHHQQGLQEGGAPLPLRQNKN